MGVWIDSGSRDEPLALNGISHFVEHMVFKGTTSRSAQQFAREVDSIGGNLDAFTGKETVCFNIKVLDEHLAPALDLLSDLVLHPTFTPEDIAREQGVILEEIKMDEDNPDYLVHETFTQNFWKGDALGRPILGTAKTVGSFTQQMVFDFYAGRFTPRNMVFSAAGNLDHERFVAQVAEHFSGLAASSESPLANRPRRPPIRTSPSSAKNPRASPALPCVPAPPVDSPQRYAVYLLNSMLGGGMSSRLFQAIREDKGLAYSIYSETALSATPAAFSIYAGTSADKAPEVLRAHHRGDSASQRGHRTGGRVEAGKRPAQKQTSCSAWRVRPAACPILPGRRCTSAASSQSTRSCRRLRRSLRETCSLWLRPSSGRGHRPDHAGQPRHVDRRPLRPRMLNPPVDLIQFLLSERRPTMKTTHRPSNLERRTSNPESGFTLIELLIVMSIMLILMALAIPQMLR